MYGPLGDVKHIQEVSAEHGWLMTLEEAHKIWKEYSNSMGASWLCLPSDFCGVSGDDELWDIISDRMTCEEDF